MRPFRYRFTLANTTRQYDSLLAHSVGESFVVCHLADAHGLCGNAETCTVHEGHHVLDEAELAAATEFRSHTTVRLMPHSRLHGSLI